MPNGTRLIYLVVALTNRTNLLIGAKVSRRLSEDTEDCSQEFNRKNGQIRSRPPCVRYILLYPEKRKEKKNLFQYIVGRNLWPLVGTDVVRPSGLSRDRLETRSAARHVDRCWYIWLGTVEARPSGLSRDRHEPRGAARHLDRGWYLCLCLQSPRSRLVRFAGLILGMGTKMSVVLYTMNNNNNNTIYY